MNTVAETDFHHTPREYQVEAAMWLSDNPHAMLADEPGLGKTLPTIRAAALVEAKSVLVVCPKSAVGMWRVQFPRCWPKTMPLPKVTIYNYDPLSREKSAARKDLAGRRFDVLIADEAHWLRNTDAKRTQYFYRTLVKRAKHVWLLTGTPSQNHHGELFPHIRALRPDLLTNHLGQPMNQDEFENLFCKFEYGDFGRRIVGSRNTAELRNVVAPFILRRRKSEYLKDLPPLSFEDYPLGEGVPRMSPFSPATGKALANMGPDEIVRYLQENAVPLATERRETGLAKVPLIIDYLKTELDQFAKIILFAYHREVIDKLRESAHNLAWKPVVVDGRTSEDGRTQAEKTFQSDPSCRLFIGQLTACSEVLTLTATDQVAFGEADWNPQKNYQAACRAHRFGQKGHVMARFLSLPGTIDERIQNAAARKTRDFAELYD